MTSEAGQWSGIPGLFLSENRDEVMTANTPEESATGFLTGQVRLKKGTLV
jgi:hypothetical protein